LQKKPWTKNGTPNCATTQQTLARQKRFGLKLPPENFYFADHRQTIDQQKAGGCRTTGLATVGKLRRLNTVNKHKAYFADGRQIGFPLSATTLFKKKDATLQG
jgi:hypothetical protein